MDPTPDSLQAWADRYRTLVVEGLRSPEVAAKIGLHLDRFRGFFVDVYGHERISTVGRRDAIDWQRRLAEGLAPATVNNHVASLSGFTTWVNAQERPGCSRQETPPPVSLRCRYHRWNREASPRDR